MKTTGSSPRTALFRSPFTSVGVDGYTTWRPGVWTKWVSGFCEWWWPPATPPPEGIRTTIGAVKPPPERYRSLAACDTSWSKPGKT